MFLFESVILVSGMSTAWKDTDGCTKKYRCSLAIFLITVLSYSYDIIMDCSVNAPGLENNSVDGLNAIDKRYLNGKIERIGKLESNKTSKIGMLPRASKDVFIKFSDQYLQFHNKKEILNGLKDSTKIKRENHYSNTNNVYTTFKGTMILITEVLK